MHLCRGIQGHKDGLTVPEADHIIGLARTGSIVPGGLLYKVQVSPESICWRLVPNRKGLLQFWRRNQEVIDEFKAFINKGNVLDLAVALILGLAFTAIVTSFTDDILMPIIGGIFGGASFSSLSFQLGDASINYGNFIDTIINFLIVAFVLFLIIRSYNRMRKPTGDETVTKECRFCLSTIPAGASRCPNCTSELGAAA
jgi:large conductance mechanosensitive channel